MEVRDVRERVNAAAGVDGRGGCDDGYISWYGGGLLWKISRFTDIEGYEVWVGCLSDLNCRHRRKGTEVEVEGFFFVRREVFYVRRDLLAAPNM